MKLARRIVAATVIAAVWLITPANGKAQPQPGCESEPYRQLDFWIGSWDVRTVDGTLVGTNVVEKTLRGCAVLEHWRDARGNEGKSLFYYLRARKQWKQVWVTDGGPMKEKLMLASPEGSVRFQGELALLNGGSVLDRTTLTALADGRLRQVIEQSTDEGSTWHATFDAFYSRRPIREAADDATFTEADRRAVLNVTEAYRDAWLANEAEGVMATLSNNAVLLPSGLQPIAGEAAIRRFWFPPGAPKTVVTAMELSVEDVHGSGKFAFVRGNGSLTLVTHSTSGASQPRTQRSWFVIVLEKQPNGAWLIARRMWSDIR